MAPLNGTPLSANRAELVDEMAGLEFHRFAGVPRELLPELKSMPVRFGQAEPYCVRWETGQALGPKFAELASDFTAGLIIRMAGAGSGGSATPIRLENTDGDPMLLINATISGMFAVCGGIAPEIANFTGPAPSAWPRRSPTGPGDVGARARRG